MSSHHSPSSDSHTSHPEASSGSLLRPTNTTSNFAAEPKRARQRISRACDACRKNKVKCPLNSSGACQNCIAASRPCTFEAVGVKRERPPTKRDIEQLNARIKTLEKLLEIMAPNIDLKSLPRTADQARSMVTVMRSKSNNITEEERRMSYSPKDLSNPNDVLAALRLLADLRISCSDYKSLKNAQSPSTHSGTSADEAHPPAQQLLESGSADFPRSVAEQCMDKYVLMAPDSFCLPPTDLADSLVALYFDKVNVTEGILHFGEFMRLYNDGLANRDRSFRGLCFSVFAAGSRFSSDYRVTPHLDGESPNQQAAGAMFLFSSVSLMAPDSLPCTLYDLQSMALLCYMTCSTCSPLTAWFTTGSSLRRVQDVGGHRENSPQWKTSIMRDQLRKRAVWYLVCQEIRLCLSLGRSTCLKHDSLSLEFPFMVDDQTLSELCASEVGSSPRAAYQLSSADLELLPYSPAQLAKKGFYSIKKRFGQAFQKLFAVKWTLEPKAWNCDRTTVAALAREVDAHFQEESSHAKWDPNRNDMVDLLGTARHSAHCYTLKILLHRMLINEDPSEIQPCLEAANALIDILDHLRNRGLLQYTSSWSPFTVTPPALTLLYVACGDYAAIHPADKANAWVGVYRCINILNDLAPTTFLAERLQGSLDRLVQTCIEQELFPDSQGKMQTSQKRGASEALEVPLDAYINTTQDVLVEAPENGHGSLDSHSSNASLEIPQSHSGNLIDHGSSEQLFGVAPCQLDASLFEYPGKLLVPGTNLGSSDWLITPPENFGGPYALQNTGLVGAEAAFRNEWELAGLDPLVLSGPDQLAGWNNANWNPI